MRKVLIDTQHPDKTHGIMVIITTDTMIAAGIALGVDTEVRPKEFILDIVVVCFQLTIRIR